MKTVALITSLSLCFLGLSAQRCTGHLTDGESGQPVPFANIGIIGKDIGTVSDAAGWFAIDLTGNHKTDSLCISCIGYEKRTWSVHDFKKSLRSAARLEIEMTPRSYLLEEVIVQPGNTVTCTLGNECKANSPYGNAFYSKELGTEMGVRITLPRKTKRALLQQFRFYVGQFTYDTFPVRLNVYHLKDGLPSENILPQPIFLEIASEGEYLVDLSGYNIVMEEDFFISLEYYRVADRAEGRLTFCAFHNRRQGNGNGYYRLASQGKWVREMFDNVGFSVVAACER